MSRLCSSLTCVVLPLLSRPSSTTNAPRATAGPSCSSTVAGIVASPTVLIAGVVVVVDEDPIAEDAFGSDEADAAGSFVAAMVEMPLVTGGKESQMGKVCSITSQECN